MGHTDPQEASAIEASLEMAAETGGDLTGDVYGRLFARLPDMRALFWRDVNSQVKGEMLARVIEAVLDFIGERRFAGHMIAAEAVTHAGYDVPPDLFPLFFETLRDSVRQACGEGWTGAMEAAWARMLTDVGAYVRAVA